MYMLMGAADNLATVLLMAQYVALWSINGGGVSDSRPISCILIVCVALTGTFWRVSVFANVVLSVTRTIKITRPFKRIGSKSPFIAIAGYGIFWAAFATMDAKILIGLDEMESLNNYVSSPLIGIETANLIGETVAASNGCTLDEPDCHSSEMFHRGILLLLLMVAYPLPVLVVLVCMVLQVWCIGRPREVESTRGSNNQRHVTVTILLLTAVFFVCHSAATVWYLCTGFFEGPHFKGMIIVHAFSYITLPLTNAAISPVIIIARSDDLKRNFTSRFLMFRSQRSVSQRNLVMTTQTLSLDLQQGDRICQSEVL